MNVSILKEIPVFCDIVADFIRETKPKKNNNFLNNFVFWCQHSVYGKKKFVEKIINKKIICSGNSLSLLSEAKINALLAHSDRLNLPWHEAISCCSSDTKASLLSKLLRDEDFVRHCTQEVQKYNMLLINKQEDDELLHKISMFVEKLRPLYLHSQSISNRKALFTYFSQLCLSIDAPLCFHFDTELVLWNAFSTSNGRVMNTVSLQRVFEKHLRHQIKEAQHSFAFLNYEYEEKALVKYIQERISGTCNTELDFFLGLSCNHGHEQEQFVRWKQALEEIPWIKIVDIYA